MKALMLYVIMLAGGAAVGAFGVGAYNVFTGEAVVEVRERDAHPRRRRGDQLPRHQAAAA